MSKGTGLDRHDAVHAIANVLTDLIYTSLKDDQAGDSNATYFANLRLLTAQGWLKSFEQER